MKCYKSSLLVKINTQDTGKPFPASFPRMSNYSFKKPFFKDKIWLLKNRAGILKQTVEVGWRTTIMYDPPGINQDIVHMI